MPDTNHKIEAKAGKYVIMPDSKDLLNKLNMCESPIEVIFLREAYGRIDGLTPQYHVLNYRIDFAIPDKKIAIEIDGHEYHKTIEQRTHDNRRERKIKLKLPTDWTIIRFTGSEIYQNPRGCIDEVLQFMNKNSNIKYENIIQTPNKDLALAKQNKKVIVPLFEGTSMQLDPRQDSELLYKIYSDMDDDALLTEFADRTDPLGIANHAENIVAMAIRNAQQRAPATEVKDLLAYAKQTRNKVSESIELCQKEAKAKRWWQFWK